MDKVKQKKTIKKKDVYKRTLLSIRILLTGDLVSSKSGLMVR